MKIVSTLNIGFVADDKFVEMYGDALKKTVRKAIEHFLITHGIEPDILSPEISFFFTNPMDTGEGSFKSLDLSENAAANE